MSSMDRDRTTGDRSSERPSWLKRSVGALCYGTKKTLTAFALVRGLKMVQIRGGR